MEQTAFYDNYRKASEIADIRLKFRLCSIFILYPSIYSLLYFKFISDNNKDDGFIFSLLNGLKPVINIFIGFPPFICKLYYEK